MMRFNKVNVARWNSLVILKGWMRITRLTLRVQCHRFFSIGFSLKPPFNRG
jgi:hypothetical protein